MIPGIRTNYNGRTYRSRLEARWAAMFDLLRWRFEYEPFDLNGYIPDFILPTAGEEIIVEVKPYTRLEQFDRGKILRAMRGTPWAGHEVLLLGATLPRTSDDSAAIGWLGEHGYDPADEDGYWFQCAAFEDNDFCAEYGQYRRRLTGYYDGSPAIGNADALERVWRAAGDAVQWRPGR